MKKEELEKMLSNGKSMLDISKEVNLSLSTIRYWCKKYQLKSQYTAFVMGDSKKIKKQELKFANLNWEEIQKFYDDGHTYREVSENFEINTATLSKYIKLGFLKMRTAQETTKLFPKPRPKMTEEAKRNLSEKRKQFLKDNPDKHSWKKSNKHISGPCEKAKEFLTNLGVNFIPEFSPEIEGRHFSIDIALPDKMIALEINGQFHYQSDGGLKPYYQERHDLLESNGWKVFQIHYSACFKFDKWSEFVEIIQNSPEVKEFDYFNYIPQEKKSQWVNCDSCENLKHFQAKMCEECARKKSRKVIWPTKEELEILIAQMPMTKIGEKYGVSDNAVKKWCKKLGVELKPMRGHWMKKVKEDKLKMV